MRVLYIIASYILFALLFPVLCLHRKTRSGLWQRLGFYSKGTIPEGGFPRVWMHGASAGDLLALSPMIYRVRERFPSSRIILTTITNSGYLMARERLLTHVDAVLFAPYDLWGATRRASASVAPDLLVLEYAEIWPNLIWACKRRGAKLALTNGRFSPAQLGRYRLLFSLVGNPLRLLDLLLMREDEEAERALALGAPLERVWVTGNTKFDSLAQISSEGEATDGELRAALRIPVGAPVWMAGSTHEGEEEKLFSVFKKLLVSHPQLKLVVAPRYIERTSRVVALAKEAHLTVSTRSAGSAGPGAQVMVLDTIGELSSAYRLATAVFVGGSFTRRGGQNILEPAAQGKPVLFGPHMENFHDSVQVLVGRGAIQVKDADHLYRLLSDLLSRPQALAELGQLAQATVRQISGASNRNVDHFERLLGLSREREGVELGVLR
jgi:3-deoxy-D-manno-octulosonic-acid transferase